MSQAKALFDAGRLDEAVEELLKEVKANPTDISRRTFLFELSCFAGDWDRAERQLDVIGQQSEKAEAGVLVYRNLIRAERDRRRLLPDGLQPHFLSEPPSYVDMHLDAVNRLREGNAEQARRTLDLAEEERPAFKGTLNGQPFTDFRDYDDLFGPVLETIVQDKYTWIPFEQVVRLQVEEPKHLRDLLWVGAVIQTTDNQLKAYLPTLYPGTSQAQNPLARLGRMTDWREVGEELYLGAGLHLLAVDGEE
ncbi:MAG TPA: type VI secretion system accessory protein TagJ, partial [Pyrinomonadaceae bacterium]|nr:type VI secretion system accessory protein TagJ [Pyrinomonadaceae bacterium]